MTRLLVLAALLASALTAGVGSAGATTECRGLQVCVPVAGPWVVLPSGGVPRHPVEYQLSCPRGYVVGGLDAELSDAAIDLRFLGLLGSPVNPGITTSRAAVFVASDVGSPARLSSFRPHLGCIPSAGGGRRVPTAAGIVPPGRPTARRVWTVRLRANSRQVVTRSCARDEELVAASHAVGFYTKAPPTQRLASAVVTAQAVRGGKVTISAGSQGAIRGTRAVVQIGAVCAGGR